MIELSIDTSSECMALALARDGEVVENHFEKTGPRMSAIILPTIERMLATAGLSKADVGLVAVCKGPGSFTGTRVGLAVAKTFGQVLGATLVGLDSLHVLAAQTSPQLAGPFHAALNCVRREIFHGAFVREGGRIRATSPVRLIDADGLARIAGREPVVHRSFSYHHTLDAGAWAAFTPAPLAHETPDAAVLLAEALSVHEAAGGGPLPSLDPIYIKPEVLRR